MKNGSGRRAPAAAVQPASDKVIRCAIYTRKSAEEGLQQDFRSLDAQREAGEAFVASQRNEGWQLVPERFDDGGFYRRQHGPPCTPATSRCYRDGSRELCGRLQGGSAESLPVVRNSIILVDFIELRLKEGMPLDQAVIDAGAVRFRPMMLTAAAVIVGSAVILFHPIFQGLALALMAGEIASLALSRMIVPVVYFIVNRRRMGHESE
jgi:hypothetical protein